MNRRSSLLTRAGYLISVLVIAVSLSLADSAKSQEKIADSTGIVCPANNTAVEEPKGATQDIDWLELATLIAACLAGITSLVGVYFSWKSALSVAKIPLKHESSRWRFDELRDLKRQLHELDISVDFGSSVLAFTRLKLTKEDLIKKCVEWGSVYNQADQLLKNSMIFFDENFRTELDELRPGKTAELGRWVQERVRQSLAALERGEEAHDALVPDVELLKTWILDGLGVPAYLTSLHFIVDRQLQALAETMDLYCS